MNKKILLIILGFFVFTNTFSQSYFKFAVYFKDKSPVGYPYSIGNPQDFLSQRAIDRRTNQGIAITNLDLPVAPSYIASVQGISDSIMVYGKSKWMNLIIIGMSDSTLINSVMGLSSVDTAIWVYKGPRPSTKADIPGPLGPPVVLGDGSYGTNYGKTFTQSDMLGINYIHRQNYRGQGMVITVLDAGFTNVSVITGFDHLRDSNRLMGTWDFVANEVSVEGDNGHGTNTFSCMGGYIPDEYIGTAPQSSYWLVRTEDAATETVCEEYNWLIGAEFADSVGSDLINSSLGYTDFDFPSMDHVYADLDGNTTIITKAADLAAATGMIICNSAGNSGGGSWHYIGAPADADSILAVGAVKDDRSKASFSSFGPAADGDVKPNVCAMGQAAYVIGTMGFPQTSNGTSFSSPILCGAVATLWSKHKDKTNFEIMDAVQKSAHIYSIPNDEYGYGIPNFGVADKLLSNVSFTNYFNDQEIVIYPNPVTGLELNFDYYSNVSETVFLNINAADGSLVHAQSIRVYEKSLNTLTIQLQKTLARGTYILNLYSSQRNFRAKFLQQ